MALDTLIFQLEDQRREDTYSSLREQTLAAARTARDNIQEQRNEQPLPTKGEPHA